jgi:Transglutaminase-like superfamily
MAWRPQSVVTRVGPWGKAIDAIPSSLDALREVSQKLVAHYMGNSDGSTGPITGERLKEVDLRYAEAMFRRLLEMGSPQLARARPPEERLAGCCRDFAVLYVSMARQKGIPARVRVGYATYFKPDWYLDHVIAEVWDTGERRWRLVEPEITEEIVRRAGFDPLDVPRDQFVTGPRAWMAARSGRLDPERFLVSPELEIPYTRGWLSLRHHVVQDLAALNKAEMLVWDQWGILNEDDPLRRGREIDELASEIAAESCPPESVAEWSSRDGFRVTPTVTSYTPTREAPLEVDVRAVLGGILAS